MTEPLDILFEDPHCLVVVKPAGLLTQGAGASAATPTLEAAVRRYLSPGAPESVYLGIVHRLDRPVSGVIVWAKTRKAARRLADAFADRSVRKEYWAIVEAAGPGPGVDELWNDWLFEADASGVVRASPTAEQAPAGARHAITRVHWEPVARHPLLRLPAGTSWLRLWPETGRTHQLRTQAARRGCPIVGDALYGAGRPFPLGIALHARGLTVRHPALKDTRTWIAPLPEAWAAAGIVLPEPDRGPDSEAGPPIAFRRR
jgi:23S rRNA pseudouridine1911/1915/1917 synthase